MGRTYVLHGNIAFKLSCISSKTRATLLHICEDGTLLSASVLIVRMIVVGIVVSED